nr:MAG TPA: hypothetical protein [Caudoviricetes sp.]
MSTIIFYFSIIFLKTNIFSIFRLYLNYTKFQQLIH